MAVGPKRVRASGGRSGAKKGRLMGETAAIPWQDEPEDMDILTGVEGLPMWSAAPEQLDPGSSQTTAMREVPSLPSNFPTLSSREADDLLGILPSRGGDEGLQALSLTSDIPQIFSVPSSLMRSPDLTPVASLAAPASGVYVVANPESLSSAIPRELTGEMVFPYMGGQEGPEVPLEFPVSRSWDTAEERAQPSATLQPMRSTVSWHEPMPEIPGEDAATRIRRGRLTSSAPQVPSRAFRTILQIPPQPETGVPIRIRVPPASERDPSGNTPRAASIDASHLVSPFDAPIGTFGSGPQQLTSQELTTLPISENIQSGSRGSTPVAGASGGPKYRVRSNALPRKRSVSETRLTEFADEAAQMHSMLRFTRSAEAKERADKAPSTTSSERGHKHSSGIDSEDSSGAAPGPKAEGRAAEPQQMVAIHPDKLNRFLLQLQTIQAKVNSLQAERVATAQKAKAVERGGSILSQLVEDMERLDVGGASVEDREAQLKARVSELKELLATSALSPSEDAPQPAPGQALDAPEAGALAPRDVSGPSTSSKDTDIPGPGEMNV